MLLLYAELGLGRDTVFARATADGGSLVLAGIRRDTWRRNGPHLATDIGHHRPSQSRPEHGPWAELEVSRRLLWRILEGCQDVCRRARLRRHGGSIGSARRMSISAP